MTTVELPYNQLDVRLYLSRLDAFVFLMKMGSLHNEVLNFHCSEVSDAAM